MSKYIIRLDDACEKRNIYRWDRIENLLDKYGVKPLVGIIPNCQDEMMDKYDYDNFFWNRVHQWLSKDWTVAMHGYNHIYSTNEGGINPVNKRSEFAGECLAIQEEKIEKGISVFRNNGIDPKVFFAPSHTFDQNTIVALKNKSNIYIISDTIADSPYCSAGMTYVPQQSGKVRKLPFSVVTFCYHPNTMNDTMFDELEKFLVKNGNKFIPFPLVKSRRERNKYDKLLEKLYFVRR